MPLRVKPAEQGESVEFPTADGLRLAGTYFRKRTEELAGVLVYCHEYLSNRWSFHPYIDHLRDLGYDIFTFDFRNHGASDHESGYSPMQWTSDREVRDLRGALAYLRSRPDHDPAGFGLFGVSRGGTTALITAAVEPSVWGVITDGAFPTRGTMVPYTIRWAEIYVQNRLILRAVTALGLSTPGLVCTPVVGTSPELSLPGRGIVGGTAGTSALADDPWRAGHLYRAGDRAGTFCQGQRAQGALAGAGSQAQSLPRLRSGGVRRPSSGLSRPVCPSPSSYQGTEGDAAGRLDARPDFRANLPVNCQRRISGVKWSPPSQADGSVVATGNHDQISSCG